MTKYRQWTLQYGVYILIILRHFNIILWSRPTPPKWKFWIIACNLHSARVSSPFHVFYVSRPTLITKIMWDILHSGRSEDRIPLGGDTFRIRPYRPWGPPSLLYNGYRVSSPVVKRPGRGVNHPPPSSAEVKERVELYLYSPLGLHSLC